MSRELKSSQIAFNGNQCHIAGCGAALLNKCTAIEKLHDAAVETNIKTPGDCASHSVPGIFAYNPRLTPKSKLPSIG
jgi:hypothetical protein